MADEHPYGIVMRYGHPHGIVMRCAIAGLCVLKKEERMWGQTGGEC